MYFEPEDDLIKSNVWQSEKSENDGVTFEELVTSAEMQELTTSHNNNSSNLNNALSGLTEFLATIQK